LKSSYNATERTLLQRNKLKLRKRLKMTRKKKKMSKS